MGRKCSAETRAKRSAAMKRRMADPEERAKQSAAMKRLFAEPEARAKRCAAMKRRYADPEERAKARHAILGYYRSQRIARWRRELCELERFANQVLAGVENEDAQKD